MIDLSKMKTGRLASTARQRRLSVPMSAVQRHKLPPAPPKFDGITGAKIQMFGNDRWGNCVFAGLANFDAIRAKLGKRDPVCNEDHVIEAYYAYNNGEDIGANETDVLYLAQEKGFKLGYGEKWMLANGMVTIPVSDVEARHSLIALIGAVYLGVALPITAMEQKVWDVTDSMKGKAAPGSWGYHAVLQGRYEENGDAGLVTWGYDQTCTEAWLQTYCDEIHVPLDALSALSPYVDFEALIDALKAAAGL